jgi:hypothetical protein
LFKNSPSAVILYGSTKDPVARLNEGFPKWQRVEAESKGCGPINWASGTAEIGDFLRGLFDSWSLSEHLLPRFGLYADIGGLPARTPGFAAGRRCR